MAAAIFAQYDPMEAATWQRWDSRHYLEIARSGYFIEPVVDNQSQSSWLTPEGGRPCPGGNVMWFPLLPSLISALSSTGIGDELSGQLLTSLSLLVLLTVVATRQLAASGMFSAFLVTMLAALFPGAIYYQALFPHSLVVLSVGVLGWFVARGRGVGSVLAGIVAGFGHTAAIFAGLGFVLLSVLPLKQLTKRQRLSALLGGGGVVLAIGIVFLAQQYRFGKHNTFLDSAACLGARGGVPLSETLDRIFGTIKPGVLRETLQLRKFCFKGRNSYLSVGDQGQLVWGNGRCLTRETFTAIPAEGGGHFLRSHDHQYFYSSDDGRQLSLSSTPVTRFDISDHYLREATGRQRWVGEAPGQNIAELLSDSFTVTSERLFPNLRSVNLQLYSLQSLFLALLVLVVAFQLVRRWRELQMFELSLICSAYISYLSTLIFSSSVSIYRLESLAFWIVLGVSTARPVTKFALVMIALPISFCLAVFFFTGDCI